MRAACKCLCPGLGRFVGFGAQPSIRRSRFCIECSEWPLMATFILPLLGTLRPCLPSVLSVMARRVILEVKGQGDGFLDMTPRAQATEEINKVNCTSLKKKKTFVLQTTPSRKWKEQLTELEKIFANHLPDKELVFINRIYKELLQLNTKKTNTNIMYKWGDISPKNIHKRPSTASKHMERCLPSLVIREMHTETTMRSHFTLTKMARIRQSQVLARMWRNWPQIHCWRKYKIMQPQWKTDCSFSND